MGSPWLTRRKTAEFSAAAVLTATTHKVSLREVLLDLRLDCFRDDRKHWVILLRNALSDDDGLGAAVL